MGNKELKKLIKNIREEDLLTLEEEIFFKEDIQNLDSEKLRVLNEEVKNKLYKNSEFKINYKNIFKSTMMVSIMTLIVIFVVIGILDMSYNYSSGQELYTKSKEDVYVLEEPITKISNKNQNLTLQSLVLDTKNNLIYVTVEGMGLKPKEEGKLTINKEEKESNSNYLGEGDNWILGHEFKSKTPYKYKQGDNIDYTITTDSNEKITFSVKLKKVQGELDCSQLGINDIKESIAIIGRVKENNNVLDLKLSSVIEGNGADVRYYGEEYSIDEYETGIKLKDSKGKLVKGKQIKHGDKFNHFEFDTTDLAKPYTIIVPKVTINIRENLENSRKIKLKLPKKGKEKINKNLELSIANYNNIKDNKAVNIKDIEKVGENKYSINIEFPQNKDNKIKISSISLNPDRDIFTKKEAFSTYSIDLNEKAIMDKIIIKPKDKQKNIIEFRVSPKYYTVEGNWLLTIK